jgi:glutathione S-transferase
MTTLVYAKGTCAIGIQVLLEEVGMSYDIKKADFSKGEQHTPEFRAINPKGKVPALVRDDGSVLTEYGAIAMWLALTNPDKKLVPADPEGMARVIEALDFAVGTLHMLSWRMFRRPDAYTANADEQAQLKDRGRDAVEKGLAVVNEQLEGKDWIAGDYSIADSALYYVEFWVAEVAKWPLPANVQKHYDRMKQRPSVQVSRKEEGVA